MLQKYPEDGETLAMKGLFLHTTGKKEEGYEYVRKGLRFSMKSRVPWHIFGVLYRTDSNYDQAIRSFLNALQHDPDSNLVDFNFTTLTRY